jgi:hypothetical protein
VPNISSHDQENKKHGVEGMSTKEPRSKSPIMNSRWEDDLNEKKNSYFLIA